MFIYYLNMFMGRITMYPLLIHVGGQYLEAP